MGLLVINTAENGIHLSYGARYDLLKEQNATDDTFHAERLALMIQDFLQSMPPPQDAIAVCIGPGGYTALRVSVALAKMLSLSYHIPLIGISSSAIYAKGAKLHNTDEIMVILETNRNHFYVQHYNHDMKAPSRAAKMILASEFFKQIDFHKATLITGSGVARLQQLYPDLIKNKNIQLQTSTDICASQYKLARETYEQKQPEQHTDVVKPIYYGNATS